ncbi:hypothetical protein [Serratia sp. M24T3]|uniref:hypothetical protein n=1 Tax=Serratia sp. M24T3 TaxID=932213 RepID=UPI00025BB93C|nr:hypothetical protein [Serratia sp. M24T3]EIC85039.1 hypothetical protein SPM24T3_08174 [Serratia sp. M24T3]
MKELNMNELEMVAGGGLVSGAQASIFTVINNATAGAVGAASGALGALPGAFTTLESDVTGLEGSLLN